MSAEEPAAGNAAEEVATKVKSGKKGRGKKGAKKKVQLPRRRRGRRTSSENQQLLELLKPSEQDVMKLLAAQVHVGRRKANVNMRRYIWKRRQDGIHVINLEKTWAKLMLAARILVTVRSPADICVMSTRTYGQRGAIKFAHYTGATPLVGKWVPGTFTNPQNKAFFEPRIILVDDPSTCFAALRETSYVGIPVIALCGTDDNTRFVDCAIPCNNRGKFSVGLMFWLLSRELLRMRGDDPNCIRTVPWKESVDLFFYRDADEIKRQQDAKLAKQQKAQRAAMQQDMGAAYAQAQEDQAVDQFDEPQQFQDQDVMYDQQQYDQEFGMGGDAANWDMPATGIEDWGQNEQAAFQQPQEPQYEEAAQFDEAAPPQYVEQGGQEPAQYVEPEQQQQQQQMGFTQW